MKLHKSFAEIDLNALSRNLRVAREKTGDGSSILAVVKADAYGHGAIAVSKHLVKEGVSVLGTAFTGEAVALRESGITAPIVVFFDRDNIDAYFRYNLTPVVFDFVTAERFSAEARRRNRLIAIHIKIDTGMTRVGFDTARALRDIPEIARLKNIRLEGLMSHFSDADLEDKEFANRQLQDFLSLSDELRRKKITFKYYHMANSAAVMSMPAAHLDMVRPGIMLYGYSYPAADGLEPVLSLKSGILMLKKVPRGTPVSYGRTFITERESIIATIPVGYADGYSRKLSNSGEVLINGKRAPVAGRVCMDTIMVDVSHIPDVGYGSEVVLMGRQGEEEITAEEIARRTGTITYEVLTSIGRRIKRVYR